MTSIASSTTLSATPPLAAGPGWLRAAIEICVLVLVAASPWAFGGVHPFSEFLLYAILGLGLLLWAARLLLDKAPVHATCPLGLCLGGMVLLGVAQIIPLPREWAERLSPAAANWRARLAPSQPEIFPDGVADAALSIERGVPLSMFPGGTRSALVRLLAVFALFTLVRNNLTSTAALRRLAILAVVNGALLALLALAQYFTSAPHVVYWRWETQGQVFGPFICRNHFPFYVNVCVGLGLGLLLSLRSASVGTGRQPPGRRLAAWGNLLVDLGNHPAALWIGSALALMFAAVLLSLSRGGLVALAISAVLCAVVRVAATRQVSGVGVALVLLLVPGLGLAAWLGTERVEKRVATLWKSDLLSEGRGPLWARVIPRVWEFPVWGSGHGTFELVEPLGRTSSDATNLVLDHAHNDYLEAWIEGGAIQLLLGLAAVVIVARSAWRTYSQSWQRSSGALVFGGLFGFLTLVVHSFTDFGLHMPANAILATVLATHLVGLRTGERATVAPRLLVRITAAAAVLGVVALLTLEGWKAERAERFRLAARRCLDRNDPSSPDKAIDYLKEAIRFAPHHVDLRMWLAEIHEAAYDAERQRSVQWRRALAAGVVVADPRLTGLPFLFLSALDAEHWPVDTESELVRRHLLPALRQYVVVRDSCPLLAEAHVRLASYARLLVRADSPKDYLARASLLAPADDRVWFLVGVQAALDGRDDEARAAWRHSLQCSDRYLGEILARAAQHSDTVAFLVAVLGDDQRLLVRSVDVMPDSLSPSARHNLLDALLTVLKRVDRPPTADELHTRSRLHQLLDQPEEAERALAAALAAAPERVEWRSELEALRHEQIPTPSTFRSPPGRQQ